MKPVIYMRSALAEEREKEIASKYFDVVEQRTHIPKGSLVIPRYSVLPYAHDLEIDVLTLGSRLINQTFMHNFAAFISNWEYYLHDYTPKTWFRVEDVPADQPGAFVLKGETNSRKAQWNTHMFAKDRQDISRVFANLLDDRMIAEQGIVVRQFEEFETFGEGLNGQPITNEWRYFIFDGKILVRGFYWSGFDDVKREVPPEADEFVQSLASIVAPRIRFCVLDVAKRKDGVWRLVEVNDGCMSGLSCIDADELYRNLSEALK